MLRIIRRNVAGHTEIVTHLFVGLSSDESLRLLLRQSTMGPTGKLTMDASQRWVRASLVHRVHLTYRPAALWWNLAVFL
jgi:hypothetical protein